MANSITVSLARKMMAGGNNCLKILAVSAFFICTGIRSVAGVPSGQEGFFHFSGRDSSRCGFGTLEGLDRKTGNVGWDLSLYGMSSTAGNMPFWAVSNRRGLSPVSTAGLPGHGGGFSAGGLVTGGATVAYMTKPGIVLEGGVYLAGNIESGKQARGMADRLYFGLSWKKLHLDIGMRDRWSDFGGLSLTGGDIVYSGNARNLPGYNLSTDYIWFPGRKKVVAFKVNFADYGMWDKRHVSHTLLHNESLFMKFRLHRDVDLSLGLEMWSQWSGVSPDYGKQPSGLKNYMRVIFGMSGGSDALSGDQANVLGNHLGRELIRLDWRTKAGVFTFQHDIPFDDGSGMGLQNFPDGVNTFAFSFKDRKAWVTDVLYEFVYTKSQSGPMHDRPPHDDEKITKPDKKYYILGGEDNYFNNGVYRSGWTYCGRTIGLPLFVTMYPDEDGIVRGIASNKLLAHHFGIRGICAGLLPYRFLFTWSEHYGRTRHFDQDQAWRFKDSPQQFSTAIEIEIPQSVFGTGYFPFSFGVGAYADFGEVFPDSFGVMIRIGYSGTHRWKSGR